MRILRISSFSFFFYWRNLLSLGLFLVLIFINQRVISKDLFREVVIQVDTNKYSQSKNSATYLNDRYLFFEVTSVSEECEITFIPEQINHLKIINILPSNDFYVTDTFLLLRNEYFRGKIKFKDLSSTKLIRILVWAKDIDGRESVEEIKLFPYFDTKINGFVEEQELFVNEDKYIDLSVSNAANVRIDEKEWVTNNLVDYKINLVANSLRIYFHPKSTGEELLKLKFKTVRPYLNDLNQLTYDLPTIKVPIKVRPSRINFLKFEYTDFFLDPSFSKNNEVQLDFSRALSMKRTYRIENQQEAGGKLIAELFTVAQVGNNNKILCWLKTYSLHRMNDGYLYVKDGDQTKFMTNFDILQRPKIERVAILKEGAQDWQNNLSVSPGESIEVKIEGNGLSRAEVIFDLGNKYQLDSSRRTDNVMFFNIKIPIEVNKRKIAILMNKEFIGYELQVKEYQRPRDFDFLLLSYDGKNKVPVSNDDFLKPVLFRDVIEDITISFDAKKIDQATKIYGKQVISIDIKMFNERKDLIEFQKIDNITICPGENSPRYSFYDLKDCQKIALSLNQYLIHKTFNLDGWSTIEITFKHNEAKYAEPVYSRKVVIIKEKYVLLDMQVSFPTGLLVKRFGENGIGRFSGISTAFLAQFSFYDRHKIGKLKPYKIGAGLIALDIFNANQAQRDLGLVILGSLSPLRTSRFSFPIYAGGGYFIQSNRWFIVFGPGIQFNF
ncbi:MAG: hypothetical protein EAZ07_06795 [Cytophagales bacterium]|nr:MAG: hypothetical protein EAZ07_06795 [Cytophagales bacterium]